MTEESVQRRLAAILAADVVAYSRLMEADEAGTLNRLKSLQRELFAPTTAEFGGRIFKFTGDGALAEFGSATNAVNSAVAIQQALADRNSELPQDQRIELRIGISLGDVIVEGGDLYGNGVNVAARMEGLAEAGGICISSNVHEHVRSAPGIAFTDLGNQQVKNISQPVRAYKIDLEEIEEQRPTERVAPTVSDKPSIAVLPFDNMSRDPEQEYFADGMAEDIITALSRFRWFYVVARHSSFIYKNQSIDVRQIGKELGVRYVLEGSVRKGGNRIRITAQMIDTETGNHLWAERYDGSLEEVFDLQDRITEGVVGAIEPSINFAEIERTRRKRPDSLDAYDFYLRALPHVWINSTEEAEKALSLLNEAIRLEPDYASAHGLAAATCWHKYSRGGFDPEVKQDAIGHCRAVIESKTDDANALAFTGFIYASLGSDKETALAAVDKAITLNPNGARTHTNRAAAHMIFGNYDTAIESAERAIRLNPLDPMRFGPEGTLCIIHYCTDNYTEAVEAAERSLQSNSKFAPAHAILAAIYVRLGRLAEAEEVAQSLLKYEPQFRAGAYELAPLGLPERMEALTSDLITAGLPE
ncbi:MAG: tetratricopeptide repeat protein [Alphaproteobacteria bacterium]|nr:tetratricopeptide repeat protein [Alphaproteobacteria bacterium]